MTRRRNAIAPCAGGPVDGPLRQGPLRHGPGAVPAVHRIAGIPLQRLGHGAPQQAQARHHHQFVRPLLAQADQLELRGVLRVVLQILPHQVQAEGLPRVPAAQHAGIPGEKALRQVPGGDGGVLLLLPDGAGIVPGQGPPALLQRLDVGGDGVNLRDGAVLDEQAVVDGNAVQGQHPVVQPPEGRLRLLHYPGHVVQRRHDAAVHLPRQKGVHHAPGVDQGDVLHAGPAQAVCHAPGGGLGVAALNSLIADFHPCALTSPWTRRIRRCSWRSSGSPRCRPPR